MYKKSAVAVFIAISFMVSPLALAASPFEITIHLFSEIGQEKTIYYQPRTKKIKVGGGPLRPFKVVIRNSTSNPQSLNIDLAGKGLGLLTFEINDETGKKNIVTRKPDDFSSKAESYIYVAPGKTKEFEILLTENEWNNAFKLLSEGASQVTVRASYKNGSNIIYSDYYTLVLDE